VTRRGAVEKRRPGRATLSLTLAAL
jgi:hypothetical protein